MALLALGSCLQQSEAADTITDEAGNPLDGEKNPGWPSGNGVAGGDFVLQFQMVEAPPKVTGLSVAPGTILATAPGEILITFNRPLNPASLNADSAKLARPGSDGLFGTADDVFLLPTGLALENGNQLRMDVSGLTLPDDSYRLLISGAVEWQLTDPVIELQSGFYEVDFVRQDSLEMYLNIGPVTARNIYVSTRPTLSSAWSAPVAVKELNSSSFSTQAHLSFDGLEVYFSSNRASGFGSYDLWMATRPDLDSAWGTPINLATINSASSETSPCISGDGLSLWFGRGGAVYVSKRNAIGDPWGSPVVETELDGIGNDIPAWVSSDALTIYLLSNRAGGKGGYDIWKATRSDAASTWNAPVNAVELNSSSDEGGLSLNGDMSKIWFSKKLAGPSGDFDIYTASKAATSGLRSLNGDLLDGDFSGTFPSGDGTTGGTFASTFVIDRSEMHVTALNITPGAALSAKPLTLQATLDKDPNSASVNAGTVQLLSAGTDGVIGTDDDTEVTPAGIAVVGGNTIKLDLTGIAIPDGPYRWLLAGAAPWRHPRLLPILNTTASDRFGSIRADGLEMFISSSRDAGFGYGYEIYTSTRADTSSPWSTPVPVAALSSSVDEITPKLSSDGLTLYFTKVSGLTRGFYYSSRTDFSSAWSVPVYMACLNFESNIESPLLSPDGLTIWYAGGSLPDIYTASRKDTFSTWTKRRAVPELSTSSSEYPTWISADTLTMYLASNRPGTRGGLDIWVTTRATTSSLWSKPVPVPGINTNKDESDFGMMPDGSTMWFTRMVGTKFTAPRDEIFTATAGAAILDPDGEPLDGDFTGTLPSGDGQPGGSLAVDFTLNRDPIAADASFGIDKDELLDDTLTGSNYAEPQFQIVANGTKGTATVTNAATGAFSYTPNAGELGTDTFTFKITDEGAESNVATVTITINDPPAANNDSASVDEGQSVNIDVAGNDTDSDDGLDLTSIQIATGVSHGTLQVNNDGTVDYTHDGSENFTDSFTYTIEDTRGSVTSAATVSITINPVNDKPVANNDSASVDEGQTVNIDVAANDTDADNALDLTSIQIVANAAHGSLNVKTDGTVDYTHDGSENFTDSFTYTIKDAGAATSNAATVSITINSVNDKPVANDDSGNVDEGQTVNIDVADNDTDADNALDLTSIQIVANAAHGSLNVKTDGTVDYTHDGSENYSDSFTYTIKDASGAVSNAATASITITNANDSPVANNDSGNVDEGQSVNIDVADNDTDAENALDLTSVQIVTGVAHGSLQVNADGTVDYTHDGSENFSDSFTYTIDDAPGATSNTATVSITINSVNDKPVANILGSDPFYVEESDLLLFSGTGTDAEDGTNVTYDWDWDDGSPNGSTQNPGHLWDVPGIYTVTLIVTDQDGVASDPVSVQVIVLPKAGERDLFLKRGKFAINWKGHADGLEKDTFFVQGWLNPAGCNTNLSGATFELSINGVALDAVPLASTGKGSTANAKASLKSKTGAFSYAIKEADLRTALGLSNVTEAGDVELLIEIAVTGAGLDTEAFAAHAAFAYTTTQDAASKGSFNYKLNASSDGYFVAVKTSVAEDKAGAHKVSAKGYVEAPGGASLAPAADVTLTIGAQTITIPPASLTVAGGVIALNKGAHPDLAKFVLDTNKKQFSILTAALSGTGVPPAGVAVTSHDLLIRIEILTAGDPIVLETSVEILRSSPTSTKWKR